MIGFTHKRDACGSEGDLLQLTNLLEDYKTQQQEQTKDDVQLDKATITKCRKLLKTKQLLQNINKYIGLSGIIGEENTRTDTSALYRAYSKISSYS